MAETPNPEPTGRNWLRWLLVASLAINLLVAGAFIGSYASPKSGKERNQTAEMAVGPYGRAFSKEDRSAMRASFEQRRGTFRENRAKMRAFAQSLAEVVRATPFEGDAVRAILTEQRALQIQMQEAGSTIMIERLEQMSPERRAAFADRLEKGVKRFKGR
ncbi:MAG: periplasmic heavy metal sensor [Pseudomonadota bacterium]